MILCNHTQLKVHMDVEIILYYTYPLIPVGHLCYNMSNEPKC